MKEVPEGAIRKPCRNWNPLGGSFAVVKILIPQFYESTRRLK